MKKIFLLLTSCLVLLTSCKEDKKDETPLPSDSIFNLQTSWQNQDNETIKLNDLKGKTLVVVMIYTSCKVACPILVSNMKKIEQKINPSDLSKVSLVLVSIDPKTDTPEKLTSFAKDNNMEGDQWIFLLCFEKSTQEFANVLSMKYKKISPLDFSHSNIITIFSPDGRMQSQEEGLDVKTDDIAAKVGEVVKYGKL